MATTTNYGFDIPVATDLVQQGWSQIATPIQEIDSFIAGSPAAGKLFHAAAFDTCAVETTTSATYVNRTNLQVTFTTGKSGVFLLAFGGTLVNSTAAAFASVGSTGAITFSPDDGNGRGLRAGTQRVGQSLTRIYSGLPNTSTTITLALKASAGTTTFDDGFMQVVNLG